MIKISAPSKVILFGEHAVVYDKKGLAGAISLRANASVKKSREIRIVLENYGMKKSFNEKSLFESLKKVQGMRDRKDYSGMKEMSCDPFLPIKSAVAKALQNEEITPFEIRINSRIPPGGLGSSSAVFASAAAAAQMFQTGKIDKNGVFEAANLGDVISHGGTPSGIDASTVTYGGFVEFQKSRGIRRIKVSKNIPIVIGNTGIPARTSETVSLVRSLCEKSPEKTNFHLDEIDRISKEALRAVRKRDHDSLGELMNENQRHLRELQVSHPRLEELISASLEAGASGAKLSGGGGGGIMIALCRSEGDQMKVSKAIEKRGGKAIITQLGARGIGDYDESKRNISP